jgi:hypothetical protein
MRKLVQRKAWLIAGLAAAALAVVQVGGPVAQSAGRDFSRCIQTCNETRKECDAICITDCEDLYPPGEDRRACESSCSQTCLDSSKECKQVCQNIKEPPSPEEP